MTPRASLPGDWTTVVLTVLTQNLYLGAPIEPLLAARSPEEVRARSDELYGGVERSAVPARAAAFARLVAARRPDVIAVQEADRWSVPAGPETWTVRTDHLAILTGALAGAGADYTVAVTADLLEVTLPSDRFGALRFLDRQALLVRAGARVLSTRSGIFRRQAVTRMGGAEGAVVVGRRGFVEATLALDGPSADGDGQTVKVIGAHLELPGEAQMPQARELFAEAQAGGAPAIVMGDFNRDLSTLPVPPSMFDAWCDARSDRELTCCREGTLRDLAATLAVRCDGVFASRHFRASAAERVLAEPDEALYREAGVWWASDHAGVLVELADRGPAPGGTGPTG